MLLLPPLLLQAQICALASLARRLLPAMKSECLAPVGLQRRNPRRALDSRAERRVVEGELSSGCRGQRIGRRCSAVRALWLLAEAEVAEDAGGCSLSACACSRPSRLRGRAGHSLCGCFRLRSDDKTALGRQLQWLNANGDRPDAPTTQRLGGVAVTAETVAVGGRRWLSRRPRWSLLGVIRLCHHRPLLVTLWSDRRPPPPSCLPGDIQLAAGALLRASPRFDSGFVARARSSSSSLVRSRPREGGHHEW